VSSSSSELFRFGEEVAEEEGMSNSTGKDCCMRSRGGADRGGFILGILVGVVLSPLLLAGADRGVLVVLLCLLLVGVVKDVL
jgi:hypothetical protein